jgi:putative membrane protein
VGKNGRRFNRTVAFEIFLLIGFASFYLDTIISGTVDRYVHPRIIPYLIFAAGVMMILAFLLLGDLYKPQKKKQSLWPLAFFALPLLMAFAVPPKALSASTGMVGEVQLSGETVRSRADAQTAQDTSGQGNVAAGSPSAEPDHSTSGTSEGNSLLQNGVIVMNSDNFYDCLNELYDHMDQYKGMAIQVIGFVFKENDDLTKNEFVPARLMMVCCAADMEPVGLLCQYDKTSELKVDSWVKVSGTMGEAEFEGKTIPCIMAQNVEPAQEPDESYVYPY